MSAQLPCFHLKSVDSTSSAAERLALEGQATPFWVVAEEQVKGRGRRGSHWVSAPGNLYASYVFDHDLNPNAGQMPLVAAVALFDALNDLMPATSRSKSDNGNLAIKWPNDLLLNGKKVAGILVESHIIGPQTRITLGFGVNCAHHPSRSNHPATHLAAEGIASEPIDVFDVLKASVPRRIEQWAWGKGFAEIRRDWLAHAAGVSEAIAVRLPSETLEGRFRGLDPEGRLILEMERQTRSIAAGDVFLLDEEQGPK